jgi:hypothetical protein
MRTLLLALFLFACGGPSAQPAPGQTALVLQVNYSVSGVDHWHITGVVLTTGRSFGPYDAQGDNVSSGQTVGLVFDPSDAGAAMVCVEARDGITPRASACSAFQIKANDVSQGSIDLHND